VQQPETGELQSDEVHSRELPAKHEKHKTETKA
jgi:hypothetical protein